MRPGSHFLFLLYNGLFFDNLDLSLDCENTLGDSLAATVSRNTLKPAVIVRQAVDDDKVDLASLAVVVDDKVFRLVDVSVVVEPLYLWHGGALHHAGENNLLAVLGRDIGQVGGKLWSFQGSLRY